MTFDEWMDKVDVFMEAICGLNSECIEDYAYRDTYDAGVSAQIAAKLALENAGFQEDVVYYR